MRISIIVAVASNGVIGRDNDLVWRLRDDMKFFSETTRGHAVITAARTTNPSRRSSDRFLTARTSW